MYLMDGNCFPEQGMECESKITEVPIVLHWIDAVVLCTVPGNLFLRPPHSAHQYSSCMGIKQGQNSKCLTTTTGTVIPSMVWTNRN